MCAYCNMGDSWFRYDPPYYVPDWQRQMWPQIPQPIIPPAQIVPWPIEKLKEYLEILKEVKALEDKIGCPCVPDKPDYIKMLQDRLTALQNKP